MILKCLSITFGVLIAITGILSIVFSDFIIRYAVKSVFLFLYNSKLRNFVIIYNF